MHDRICACKSSGICLDSFYCRNFNLEDGDHVSYCNGVKNADKFISYILNVPNKPTSSENNSSTGFFSLGTSNLGSHERYGYCVKRNTDMPRVSDGGYILRALTPHKYMLNT